MQTTPYDYKAKIDEFLSTGKNKSYFVAAVTVFFVLIMSFAGIIPAVSSLGLQAQENAKRQEILSKLETKIVTLKNFIREKQDKSDLLDFFDSVFPTEPDQVSIINKIIEISDINNVDILSFTFLKATTAEDLLSLPLQTVSPQTKYEVVNLTGEGFHQEVIDFIESIEESRAILNVSDVALSRKVGSPTGFGDYTFSLKIRYYYYDINTETP